LLTLHQQPDRRETYEQLRPFSFDEHLRVLCVYDADMISAIFRSEDFRTNPFADHYREIAERTGIDFQASIETLDHVPFSKEGEEHRRLRAEMNKVVSAESREHIAGMEAFIAELTARLFVAGNEIELTSQLAHPIFFELFGRWLKVDEREFMEESNYSAVFDSAMSLNRRKRVNASLEGLRCAFAQRSDRLPTTAGIALAMNVVGNDALLGSLVLSLWHVLEQNPGARLSDIAFPPSLVATGVPFIERIANREIEINGMKVAKDEKVRLVIDATSRQITGEEADLFFGKGRHLCIGKPMTLVIWRAIAKALRENPLRFTMRDMKLRTGDYAFNFPEFAWISLHE
jgi:cytochrome P450